MKEVYQVPEFEVVRFVISSSIMLFSNPNTESPIEQNTNPFSIPEEPDPFGD